MSKIVGSGVAPFLYVVPRHRGLWFVMDYCPCRGDFGLWAIEVAKQIVADQGYELARAARDGSEDDVRVAGNALGQAITNAMMEVFDGLTEGVSDA